VRCVDAATGAHAFATAPAGCDDVGGGAPTLLGHVAAVRGGEMLRALRRCRGPPGAPNASYARYHALDIPCDHPDGDGAVLGFVR
jgi:hypothetical protein